MSAYMWRGKGSAFFLNGYDRPESGNIPASAFAPGEDVWDLSESTTGLSGFERSSNPINVPILKFLQEEQIAGPEQFATPRLDFVHATGDSAQAERRRELIRNFVPGQTSGLLVFFLETQEPTDEDEFYSIPVGVSSKQPNLTLDAQASQVFVNLTASGPMLEGVVGGTES